MTPIRLLVLVEGETEQGFVTRVLAPHLVGYGVYTDVALVTTKWRRGQRLEKGGGRSYENWRNDLYRHRKSDANADRRFTTMLDLYGLASFRDPFPGYQPPAVQRDVYKRVEAIEQAFAADVDDPRFIPYIQLHEYEALLPADPQKLELEYVEHGEAIARLVALTRSFESPELIDEGEQTAPSKRIVRELPEYAYNKPRVGTLVAAAIGLPKLREKCTHFDAWIGRLEALGGEPE